MPSDNTPQFLLTLLTIAVVTGVALIVKIQDLRAINEQLLSENQQLDRLVSQQTDIRQTNKILNTNQ